MLVNLSHIKPQSTSELCFFSRLPGWVASLLCTAKCLKSDRARRKKFYRLLQRKLVGKSLNQSLISRSKKTKTNGWRSMWQLYSMCWNDDFLNFLLKPLQCQTFRYSQVFPFCYCCSGSFLIVLSQFFHGIGVERNGGQPTYVYPAEVKKLLRSVFSQNICDYADPRHEKVSRG